MNNYVHQDSDGTKIVLGDWYIGIYIEDDGSLSVYVDNENGDVKESEVSIAEDDKQWARSLLVESKRPTIRRKTPLNDPTIWSNDSIRRNVRVEVQH